MSIIFRILYAGLIICTVLSSCIKHDYSNVSDSFSWEPIVSGPFYKQELTSNLYLGDNDFKYDYINLGEVNIGDTIDFDFDDIFNVDEVQQLMFRIEIKNGYPADLKIEANYLDTDFNLIKPVLQEPLQVGQPKVDDKGNVSEVPILLHDEYVNAETISEISDAKHIFFLVNLTNVDDREVVVDQLDTYKVDFNLGIRAYLKIENE